MEELNNKISVTSAHIGTHMLDELELHGPCKNILDYQYGMRDVLRILNEGTMYSDTYRLVRIEFGGNEYGRFRCHMAAEYYDDKDHRIDLYYYGDGMFYAYSELDNGETLCCLFDDHNWRIEHGSYIFHDMMEAFRKEYNKHNK